MAKRKGGRVACPAKCGREDFPNAGAAASHARLAKDSLHVAHRGRPGESPKAAAQPAAEPVVEPEPAPEPVVEVKQEKSQALAEEAEKATRQEAPPPAPAAASGAVLVSFQPPAVVQPLAPSGDQKAAPSSAPSPTGEQKPATAAGTAALTVSTVQIEPFIAGAVSTIVNAFAIDEKQGDTPVTRQEVGDTGFPKAIELSVRKYYPNLPLDHPLVLLAVSSSGMVALVKKHRAPRTKGQQHQEEGGEADEGAAAEPEPVSEPVPAAKAPVAGQSAEGAIYANLLAVQS